MKSVVKKTLGIDISQNRISVALLKKDGSSLKLVKAAEGPVPADALKDGHIENASILAKAVKKLKNRCTIRPVPAALSLFTEPTVVQIMDIPGKVPSNIGKYVLEQVKHFAALLGKKIALDFFGISGVGADSGLTGQVFSVATDGEQIDKVVQICNQTGIVAEAIEQPLLSCIRALYAEKINGRFDSNVLIALLRDKCLTLCVFKRQTLDFVRVRKINGEASEQNSLCQWLAHQMSTVIRSYDVEVPLGGTNWEITVVADDIELNGDAQEVLKANIENTDIQVINGKDISQAVSKSLKFDSKYKPSLAAVGLAMKLFDSNASNLGVNLLPAEVFRVRSTQKRTLISANIMAAVLLFTILATLGPIWKINRLMGNIEKKKARLSESTQVLVETKESVNGRITTVKDKLNSLNTVLSSHPDVYWPGLLNEIAKKRPKTVLVTSFASGENSQVLLKGLAISNEDIYLFIEKLGKSELIESATIIETKIDQGRNGLVSYEIRCSLTDGKDV